MEDFLVSVEFRHASWFDGRAHAGHAGHGTRAGPGPYRGGRAARSGQHVPAVWACTHPDLTLLRLHGRNAGRWGARGAASSGRFQYEYSQEELAELAQRFVRLARESAQAHAVFNTNFEDQGMRNAAAFQSALRAY
nr:DUF72 domain-containing protein [Achromobacter sp. DMS1]